MSFNALDSMFVELGSIISEKREIIYSTLAAMLHMGNISFKDNGSSIAEINDEDGSKQSLEYAAILLRMSSKQLQTILIERHIMKNIRGGATMYVTTNH